MIIEGARSDATQPLTALVQNGSPAGRLHALWTLEGLGKLADEVIQGRFKDLNEYVRGAAVDLAAVRIAKREMPWTDFDMLRDDRSELVRFRYALAIGSIGGESCAKRLAQLLTKYPNDRWLPMAVQSSASDAPLAVLRELRETGQPFAKNLA